MQAIDDGKVEAETRAIYNELLRLERGIKSSLFEAPKLVHPDTKRLIVRYIVAPFLLALFALLGTWFYSQTELLKLIVLLLLLVGYVGIVVVHVLEFYADRIVIRQMFRNPLVLLLEDLSLKAAKDVEVAKIFERFSSESLKLVRSRLETQSEAVPYRLGTMVGPLEKMGVVPGLITLYLAAAKGPEKISMSIAVAVFFVYSLALAVHQAVPRLGFYLKLLNSEIASKESDKTQGNCPQL